MSFRYRGCHFKRPGGQRTTHVFRYVSDIKRPGQQPFQLFQYHHLHSAGFVSGGRANKARFSTPQYPITKRERKQVARRGRSFLAPTCKDQYLTPAEPVAAPHQYPARSHRLTIQGERPKGRGGGRRIRSDLSTSYLLSSQWFTPGIRKVPNEGGQEKGGAARGPNPLHPYPQRPTPIPYPY
jgi:hypothetical protein